MSDQDCDAGEEAKDNCKIFVGGLDYRTQDEALKKYFNQFGTVIDYIVMKDARSGRSRCFGFVTFLEPYMVDQVLRTTPHVIDGKKVDPKRALPRDLCIRKDCNDRKLFVGGLARHVITEDVENYFSQFGELSACDIVINKETGMTRGFGFIEYFDVTVAGNVLAITDHEVKGRHVDVKKAMTREELRAAERSGVRVGRGRGRWGRRDCWRNSNWGGNGRYGGYNYGWGSNWGGGIPWYQWGCQGGYPMLGGYAAGYSGGYAGSGGGYHSSASGSNMGYNSAGNSAIGFSGATDGGCTSNGGGDGPADGGCTSNGGGDGPANYSSCEPHSTSTDGSVEYQNHDDSIIETSGEYE